MHCVFDRTSPVLYVLSMGEFVAMNANCDPILDMRVSQEQLRAMYERNPALARANQYLTANFPAQSLTSSPMPAAVANSCPVLVKSSKYRNVKVEHEGMKFDSKHELQCWKNLKLREKAGEIYDLERQVPFSLEVNGIKIGRFTADFYWKQKVDECSYERFVADAKSPATRKETAYRLRKKLFEAIYAPLVIREL